MWLLQSLIVIVLVGILFLVVFVITGVSERDYLSGDVEPVYGSYPYQPSSYWQVTGQEAARVGMRHGGDFATKRNTSKVKGLQSMWISEDGLVIAAIVGGAFARIPFKKTVLRSRLGDGRVIESSDNPGIDDITQGIERAVLLNAGFAELMDFHRARLRDSGAAPLQFDSHHMLSEYEKIDLERGTRLVDRGWALWTDPGRSIIRLTLTGSLIQMKHSLFMQGKKLRTQEERIKIPRAGSRKYGQRNLS